MPQSQREVMTKMAATETQPLVPKTAAFTIYEEYQSTSQDGMPSISEDAWDTVKLGIQIFVARLSFVGVSKQTHLMVMTENGNGSGARLTAE
jgi:hypothetical protein